MIHDDDPSLFLAAWCSLSRDWWEMSQTAGGAIPPHAWIPSSAPLFPNPPVTIPAVLTRPFSLFSLFLFCNYLFTQYPFDIEPKVQCQLQRMLVIEPIPYSISLQQQTAMTFKNSRKCLGTALGRCIYQENRICIYNINLPSLL